MRDLSRAIKRGAPKREPVAPMVSVQLLPRHLVFIERVVRRVIADGVRCERPLDDMLVGIYLSGFEHAMMAVERNPMLAIKEPK